MHFLLKIIFSHKNKKKTQLNYLIPCDFIATAVEDNDDEDDDEDDDSEGFSDNDEDEEMINEENRDFGLKSLLEEDENKQSQVKFLV